MENSDIHSDVTKTDTLSVLHVSGMDKIVDDTQKKTSTIVLWFNRELIIHGGSWITFAVLISSLFATHQLWKKAEEEALRDLQNQFTAQALKSVDDIGKQIVNLEHILIALESLFSCTKKITFEEYQRYVRNLLWEGWYDSVWSIRFSPLVFPDDSNNHSHQPNWIGFPASQARPSQEELFYVPLEFCNTRSDLTFLYNVCFPYAENKKEELYPRHFPEAVNSAVHSGKVVVSATPTPFIRTDTDMRSAQLTMLRAIYGNESHPHQPKDAIGLASLTFDIQRLMKDILGDFINYFDTRIYDGESESNGKILYESPRRSHSHPVFQENRTLKIGERTWVIAIRSLPEFENRISKKESSLTAIAGGLTSLFLTLFVGTLIRNHAQVIRVAENEHLTSRKLEEALRNLSLYNESVNEHTIISVTDVNWRIMEANEQFYKTTQYSREEIIGKTHRIFKSWIHPHEFYDDLWDTIKSGKIWRNEVCNRKKDGSLYWADVSIVPMKNEKRDIIGYIAIRIDISKHKEEERKLLESASHDTLTGLPNRLLMIDRLNQAIIQSQRNHRQGAVLFVDLDRFKAVNDYFWHGIGDQLLKEVSKKMYSLIRHEDTIARHGGDEFIVILSEIAHPEDARVIAKKIISALSCPHLIDGSYIDIGASIGISVFPRDGTDAEKLIRKSDAAMYRAKKWGRNSYRFFSSRKDECEDI